MAIGSQECKLLGIEGEDFTGVWPGVDYLLRSQPGREDRPGRPRGRDRRRQRGHGRRAHGPSAMRSKAPFIIYRRSEAEMPASAEEIAECREEGIEIMTLVNPGAGRCGNRGSGHGRRMHPHAAGRAGRHRDGGVPEPIPGSEFTIDVDAVVPAIGQESDWACLTDECACTLSDWGTMIVDPVTLQSADADIFAGGDAVSGPAKPSLRPLPPEKNRPPNRSDAFSAGEDLEVGRDGESLTAVEDVDLSNSVPLANGRPCPEP